MAPRMTTRGKTARTRKAAGKPKPSQAARPPEELTYAEMQTFLHRMERWWTKLDGDVKGLDALIKTLPIGQAVSPGVKRQFRGLVGKMLREAKCTFPHLEGFPL